MSKLALKISCNKMLNPSKTRGREGEGEVSRGVAVWPVLRTHPLGSEEVDTFSRHGR